MFKTTVEVPIPSDLEQLWSEIPLPNEFDVALKTQPSTAVADFPELAEFLATKKYHEFFEGVVALMNNPGSLTPMQQICMSISLFHPNHSGPYNPVKLLDLITKLSVRVEDKRVSLKYLHFFLPLASCNQDNRIVFMSIVTMHLLSVSQDAIGLQCMDSIHDIPFGLSTDSESVYHRSLAMIYSRKRDYNKTYKHTLFYIKNIDLDTLDDASKKEIAEELCRCLLLSRTLYSFSEIIPHPILQIISPGSPFYGEEGRGNVFRDLLILCNNGNYNMFMKYVEAKKSLLAENGLEPYLPMLKDKIQAFALLETAFMKPQTSRSLTFKEISDACCIQNGEVEPLITRVMSTGLIQGKIDAVEQVMAFTSLQPRMLDLDKISVMSEQFKTWSKQMKSAVDVLTKMAPELVQSTEF